MEDSPSGIMRGLGSSAANRAAALYREQLRARRGRADRMFAILMIAQWGFAIALALLVSPYAWEGKTREFHPHLLAALFRHPVRHVQALQQSDETTQIAIQRHAQHNHCRHRGASSGSTSTQTNLPASRRVS